MARLALLILPGFIACAADPVPHTPGLDAPDPTPVVSGDRSRPLAVGEQVELVATGLDDDRDYRVELFHGDAVGWLEPGVAFEDTDGDGLADPGPVASVAGLAALQGQPLALDAAPIRPLVTPEGGALTATVQGFGAGEVWLVVYESDPDSDGLELDDRGRAPGPHGVSSPVVIASDGWPDGTPVYARTVSAGERVTATFTDLVPGQVYRVGLVGAAALQPDEAAVRFADDDGDGVADSGGAIGIGRIVAIHGADIVPADTYPSLADDPAAPSGVTAIQGRITVTIEGVGPGELAPVLYPNGGASTLLEVDAEGLPLEPVGVGGRVLVVGVGGRPGGD